MCALVEEWGRKRGKLLTEYTGRKLQTCVCADLCVCRPALPEPGCEAAAEVRGGREETNGDPQEAARGAGEE